MAFTKIYWLWFLQLTLVCERANGSLLLICLNSQKTDSKLVIKMYMVFQVIACAVTQTDSRRDRHSHIMRELPGLSNTMAQLIISQVLLVLGVLNTYIDIRPNHAHNLYKLCESSVYINIGELLELKIFWGSPIFWGICHALQLWPQTIVQSMDSNLRNIAFMPLLGGFFVCVLEQNFTVRSNALHRRKYCLTASPRLLKHPVGTILPQFKPFFRRSEEV